MRTKGFTLIDLTVVIPVVVLSTAILVSSLDGPKEPPRGVTCGSNLSGIGKAMAIYSNDDENGRFPRAGGRKSKHGPLGGAGGWTGVDEVDAFGNIGSNTATITSSLWLLVKGDYATAKQFVCPSDPDTTGVFRHSDPWAVWDFGPTPGKYCSYAYHFPYDNSSGYSFGLSSASNPAMAVCADRNPEPQTSGNSRAHQGEGQYVLYVDGHVDFERNRNCGPGDDDIYTAEDGGSAPVYIFDSYLINEPF